MTTLPQIPDELIEAARREEQQAANALLAKCAADDMREQLAAAADLLGERTGMSPEEVNTAIAARRAQKKGQTPMR